MYLKTIKTKNKKLHGKSNREKKKAKQILKQESIKEVAGDLKTSKVKPDIK